MTQAFDAPNSEHTRLLDRQLAAAYVGVTIGLFEKLIREDIVPQPVVVGRKPLWCARLLDQSVDAIRRIQDSARAGRPPANRPNNLSSAVSNQGSSNPGDSIAEEAATIMPDQAWLMARADLVRRVRKSPLSQHELGMLGEFSLLQSREVSMFGFYRTFEALMARGLVVETARSGPASRPFVTYRLTPKGISAVASMGTGK